MSKLGWNVRGMDLNKDAVAIAKAHGLQAETGTWDTSSLPDECLDVVNMGDVIEHLSDPLAAVQWVWKKLRTNGLLVIRTPDNQSGYARLTYALARATRLSWAASEAPFHLFEFSDEALSALLERARFSVLSMSSSGHSRFAYRLGACGLFDELKATMKATGSYRWNASATLHAPILGAASLTLLPCYLLGLAIDRGAQRGDSLLAVARKLPAV
jgi:SAM-dependent methyltransferase